MNDPDDPSPADLVEPPTTDPFQRILWFLEQCRKRNFRIGPALKVGNVTMQVADLRQARGQGADETNADPGIWKIAGHDDDEFDE